MRRYQGYTIHIRPNTHGKSIEPFTMCVMLPCYDCFATLLEFHSYDDLTISYVNSYSVMISVIFLFSGILAIHNNAYAWW